MPRICKLAFYEKTCDIVNDTTPKLIHHNLCLVVLGECYFPPPLIAEINRQRYTLNHADVFSHMHFHIRRS